MDRGTSDRMPASDRRILLVMVAAVVCVTVLVAIICFVLSFLLVIVLASSIRCPA